VACWFLDRFNGQHRRHKRLAPESLALLGEYAWPGNVRELERHLADSVK